MTQDVRTIAAIISDHGVWTDADAVRVADAYLELLEVAQEIARTSVRSLNLTLATEPEWRLAEMRFRDALA